MALRKPRKTRDDIIKPGTKSRNSDYQTKKSKYADAVLAVVMNPENWKYTISQISKAAGDILRKQCDKKATNPSYSTVVRIMKHPEFKDKLREQRSQFLLRALPAIEYALVRHTIEGGDVKAYDRILRILGEDADSKVAESESISDDKLKEIAKKIINRK